MDGSASVCAFAQDGSGKSSCCEVIVNVPVESVMMDSTTRILHVGEGDKFKATALPENANNRNLRWTSSKPEVASVNSVTGYVTANAVGETNIIATAQDGSDKYGVCVLTVEPPIAVQGIDICCESYTMDVGETTYLSYDIYPSDATNKSVTWCSTNPNVAEVNASTGRITAKKVGTTTITATTGDGCFVDSCELWVHGKTPVFLIHGRTSNSKGVWGINNNISSGKNNDFKSDINAVALNGEKYIEVDSQELGEFEPNNGNEDADYPCNLGNKLIDEGYKKNVNLFAFNYPNQDAVVHSAKKFAKYIENLIDDVRTSGTDEKKACFYASRNDYNNNNYKINIVGHSMGGLVARYFIENLYQDNYVDKLITICTPHWGSGYGDLSSYIGTDFHALCDHDLDFDSAMFGGSSSTSLNCNAIASKCYTGSYTLTDELLYNREHNTKYYAIAGVDYDAIYVNLNDHTFEMPTNFTTSQQITDYLFSKNVYKLGGKDSQIKFKPYPESIGDNMVGLLSQIGWIGDNNNVNTPEPKIQMHRIFVDVDTNGGNGGETFVWEAIKEWLFGDVLLHSKIPHRIPVIEKIIQFLGE